MRGSATQSGLSLSDPVPWPSTASAWSKGVLSDCPVGWWAYALPSLDTVSDSSSPPLLLSASTPPFPPESELLFPHLSFPHRWHPDVHLSLFLAVSGMSCYPLRLVSIPDSSLPTLCSLYPLAMAASLTDVGPSKPKYIARPQHSSESSRHLSTISLPFSHEAVSVYSQSFILCFSTCLQGFWVDPAILQGVVKAPSYTTICWSQTVILIRFFSLCLLLLRQGVPLFPKLALNS